MRQRMSSRSTQLLNHLTKHQNSGNPHPHNCNQYKSCIFLVDCKVDDWSAWGVCSVTCGSGTKSKGRDVVQEPNPLGAMCPHLEETHVCNTNECKGTFLYLGSDLWVRMSVTELVQTVMWLWLIRIGTQYQLMRSTVQFLCTPCIFSEPETSTEVSTETLNATKALETTETRTTTSLDSRGDHGLKNLTTPRTSPGKVKSFRF